MTQANQTKTPGRNLPGTRMIIGAGIGLLVISFFLIPSEAKPEWGKFWMIRPLLIAPFAGAMGALCNYLILNYHDVVGVNKTVARILAVLVPIVGMWMGIVLGLDGTMWD
ncbi:MAG TPA: potassium transporter KefB [Chryseosolibacter sp.]